MSEEYARRAVHVSGTLVPAAYLAEVLPWRTLQYFLAAGAALAVVLEAVRLVVGIDWVVFDRLTREYERDNPAGYALAVVAAALVVWAFAPTVAVPALLMLTIADPFAGVLGSTTGPDDRKGPGVAAATFLVCLAIAVPFLPPRAALPAAAVAVAADAVKPRVFGFVVDDNFSIPVGAALAAFLSATYLPAVLCEGSCLGVGLP
jgi:dolichol kinase